MKFRILSLILVQCSLFTFHSVVAEQRTTKGSASPESQGKRSHAAEGSQGKLSPPNII
jgi:hypothetical protein